MATAPEVLAALRKDAAALLDMGAVEFAMHGKTRAQRVVDGLLALVEHVVTVQAATAINLTRDFAELRARLDALENKPRMRAVPAAVKNAVVVEEQCKTT